jgi:hypothetical protein
MSVGNDLRALLRVRLLQLLALTAFLAIIGGLALHYRFSIIDLDIWWHLKVGDWIVQHKAVPHTGILSRTAASRPWVAYSWGYEVLLSLSCAWFGLVGMGVYGVLLTIGVAYVIYWMLLRLSGQFWLSLLGASVTCAAFLYHGSPRPFFFSMMLFGVVMTLLLESHRDGKVERLNWLPLIFLLWTNLHIQFIYGLFAIGLLAGVCVVEQWLRARGVCPDFLLTSRIPAPRMLIIFGLCVLATLIGPNTYHSYISVLEYSRSKFSYQVIIELQPPSFRNIGEYIELLLAAAGFFVIGWRRKMDTFKIMLLTVACILGFRTMRDGWYLCMIAAAILYDFPANTESDGAESWMERATVLSALALVLVIFASSIGYNERGMDRAISADYPVNAINFLRRYHPPGPLYNDLNWGGFLTWYMPDYPVAIDGRNDLYGDELDKIFFKSQNGDTLPTADPYLGESGVVLLHSDLPLAKMLAADPRFQLIYQDHLATVYVRR